MIRIAVIGTVLVMASGAHAQQPRSVEWFIMHNSDRAQTLRYCTGGIVSPLHDAECINANQAGAWMRKAADERNRPRDPWSDPQYYSGNPIAARAVLSWCSHPTEGLAYTQVQCQAARIGGGG